MIEYLYLYVISLIVGGVLLTIHFVLAEYYDKENKKTGLMITIMTFLGVALIAPLSVLSLDTFFGSLDKTIEFNNDEINNIDSTSLVLIKLDNEAENLQRSLQNPKELKLSEIENLLSRTLSFSSEMRAILVNQKETINKLIQEVKIEKKKAEESQKIAREIQSLTKSQLEAVKLLITEDAKIESRESFYMGLAVSFPIGILASLFASFLFKRFNKEIKNEVKRIKEKS